MTFKDRDLFLGGEQIDGEVGAREFSSRASKDIYFEGKTRLCTLSAGLGARRGTLDTALMREVLDPLNSCES